MNRLSRSSLQINFVAGLAIIALGTPVVTLAQQATGDADSQVIDMIVVTAQKREQNLLDVPVSLTVFDADRLDMIRAVELSDYLQYTPNVSVQGRGDRFTQFFTIRGFQNFGGRANALSVYVDEFDVAPATSIRTYNQNLVDVERIEVLRGPQGTTFGRNTMGGAVNIITKKPDQTFSVSGTVDAGWAGDNGNSTLIRGSLNLPLGDSFAARLSAVYEDEEGWIENVNPESGVDSDDYDGTGVRAALRWMPNDALTADVTITSEKAQTRRLNTIPTGIVESGTILETLQQAAGPFLAIPIPYDPFGIGFYPDNDDKVFALGTPEREFRTDMINGRVEWDLGTVTLTSVTGYIDNESENVNRARQANGSISGDTTGLNFIYSEDPQLDLQSFSQELRAQIDVTDSVFLQIGALYAEDEEVARNIIGTGEGTDLFGFLPSPPFPPNIQIFPLPPNFILSSTATVNETSQRAAFASLSARVSAPLEIVVGGRYTSDDVDQTVIDFLSGSTVRGSEDFDEFTGSASLVYSLTDRSNFYATLSQGFKSGGLALTTGKSYDSETVDNFEIGFKGDFLNGRLRANVAAFKMDWSDVQVNVTDADPASPTFLQVFTQNAADADINGIEAELIARPIDPMALQLGIGYLDTEFTGQDCTNPDFIATGDPCLNGTSLPRQSEWTLNWSAQYDFRLTTMFDAYLRVDGSYRSEMYDFAGSLPIKDQLKVEGFDLWNLRLGLKRGKVSGMLYIENLFDSNEVVGLRNPGGIEFGGIGAVLVAPRTAGIRITVDFDDS